MLGWFKKKLKNKPAADPAGEAVPDAGDNSAEIQEELPAEKAGDTSPELPRSSAPPEEAAESLTGASTEILSGDDGHQTADEVETSPPAASAEKQPEQRESKEV